MADERKLRLSDARSETEVISGAREAATIVRDDLETLKRQLEEAGLGDSAARERIDEVSKSLADVSAQIEKARGGFDAGPRPGRDFGSVAQPGGSSPGGSSPGGSSPGGSSPGGSSPGGSSPGGSSPGGSSPGDPERGTRANELLSSLQSLGDQLRLAVNDARDELKRAGVDRGALERVDSRARQLAALDVAKLGGGSIRGTSPFDSKSLGPQRPGG